MSSTEPIIASYGQRPSLVQPAPGYDSDPDLRDALGTGAPGSGTVPSRSVYDLIKSKNPPQEAELLELRVPGRPTIRVFCNPGLITRTQWISFAANPNNRLPNLEMVDEVKIKALALIMTNVEITIDGSLMVCEDGSKFSFKTPEFRSHYTPSEGWKCVREFFINENHLVDAANEVLVAAGIGSQSDLRVDIGG